MITKDNLILKYLNIPYEFHGNDLTGLDCWTLVVNWFNDLNYDLNFMNPQYGKNCKWNKINNFIFEFADKWEKVKVPRYLDIILFRGETHHCGICLDEYRFIHCNKNGVKILRINKNDLSLLGFYRLREITNDNCKI